jgi:indole-3-glycerol phosphate synthase
MSILQQIVRSTSERVMRRKASLPLAEVRKRLRDIAPPRDFRTAITRKGDGIRLIAEIKKASPSKGLLRQDFDPPRIAAIYEQGPVDAISVLTEEDYFLGSPVHVARVKAVTSKPVLKKDFVLDEYQICEARLFGADAVLLIAAILDSSQAAEYLQLAAELGLGVLFEVHDEGDLEKALAVDADTLGINNRDLRTFQVNLDTTMRLKKEIPEGKTVVSESGISDREDVERLDEAGIDAMLVGTSLMRSSDIAGKIRELMTSRPRSG